MSVLEVVGEFKSEHYLPVEQHRFIPDVDTVDMVGYPGILTPRQIQHMHPCEDMVELNMVKDVEMLFPRLELIVTHESVVFRGIQPSYRLSIVSGLSGAPVLLNGNVIGKI